MGFEDGSVDSKVDWVELDFGKPEYLMWSQSVHMSAVINTEHNAVYKPRMMRFPVYSS
jgi:hypothetical protein